jgi:uncharacterized protein (TIGR02246 family)
MLRPGLVLGTILALGTSAVPVSSQTAKADPAQAAVEKSNKLFSEAFARADFKTLAAMYDEDAVVLPPDGDMVKGRPAIEAFWKGVYDSGVKGATLSVVDVTSSGDLAGEVGTAVLTIKPPNAPEAAQKVKYVVVWKKQKDGGWKLYRDIWNGMPAAGKP